MQFIAGLDPLTLYRNMVGQAEDAMIFVDRDEKVLIWNHGAEKIFGYSADEMLGHTLEAIVPERFQRAHSQGFQRAVSSGESKYSGRAMTTRSTHKNGNKLYVELSFTLVKDDAGTVVGVLSVARDCTERQLAAAAANAAKTA